MDMQQADGPLVLDHEEAGDPGLVHAPSARWPRRRWPGGGWCGACASSPPPRAGSADRAPICRRRSPSVMMPTSAPAAVDDADAAQPLGGHLDDRLAAWPALGDQRQASPACISSVDPAQLLAELAAGVEGMEIVGGEAAALQQGHRERIAQRQHHGGGGGGGQAHAGRLLGARGRIRATSAASASALSAPPVTAISGNAEALGMGDDMGQLRRPAGIGEGDDRIALGAIMPRSPWLASAGWTNRAGVPVEARVAAILRATMAALAHAGDDHPALDRRQADPAPGRSRRASRLAASAFRPSAAKPQNALGNARSVGGSLIERSEARHGRWSPSLRRITVHFRGRTALMGKNVGLVPAAQIELARVGRKPKQASAKACAPRGPASRRAWPAAHADAARRKRHSAAAPGSAPGAPQSEDCCCLESSIAQQIRARSLSPWRSVKVRTSREAILVQ